ncbi:MAG: putative concanavalin A-like lectin/glucanases superfamily protein [Prokaryotic dsDNA virus sp.]|nr:MAG: putative concanavalin A-like lectin/glucanases superfamily protein [Prokaryotic dsDNA virus sp.]|tara:strand:- start:10266 stop:11612 length:1347 start_codon:yes stop_codon:yes gene_type:complete
MPRGTRPTVRQPEATGDCEQRWERASGSVAANKWFNIAGGSGGADGTPTLASIMAEFHFDGGTDKVDTTYEGAPKDADNDWTCVFWAIRDSSDDGQVTLAQNRGISPNRGTILARDNSAGSYDAMTFNYFNPGFVPSIETVKNVTDDAWHFIVVTWDADGGSGGSPSKVASFWNGAANASSNTTAYDDGTEWIVGGGTYNRFTGFIDTFRVYPRVLSDDEIKRDYYAGLAEHQARVVEENLISQYVPQGMTPTAWTDVTGSNNMTGAVTDPPAFDGDDYYTIGQPANLEFSGAFTVEAWASQVNDSSQGSERIVSLDGVNGQRSFLMSMRDNTGKANAFIFSDNVNHTSLESTSTYTNNNWHHIVIVNYGAGQPFQMWIDGVLEDEDATGGRVMQGYSGGKDWEIGRAQLSSHPDYLEGRCDTVRFYNAALSKAQIKQNYYNGLAAHS